MVGDVTCRHGAMCVHAMWQGMCTHVCTHVCAHGCAHVCSCVCASVISGLSILLRVYSNLLNALQFYTNKSTSFSSLGTIFLFRFYIGDVK